MRFSASITTEENILSIFSKKKEWDDLTPKEISTTTGYEMESVEHTIQLLPDFDSHPSSNKLNLGKMDKGKLKLFPSLGSMNEVSRIRIGRNEYFYLLKEEKVLTAFEDLALKSGKYMIPFLLTYCQKMKDFCKREKKQNS